jgi:hypothetical protein
VADRIAFWTRLHERLARLANRLDAEAQAKVLGAVHERIPMVTLAEQCALQLENANADLRFWNGLAGMHAETIERHKALTVTAERKIADSEAERAKVAEKAAQARDRVARIERGEDVQGGGFGQPVTYDDVKRMLRGAGWTTSDIRHADLLNVVAEARRKTRVLDHDRSRNEGPKGGLRKRCCDGWHGRLSGLAERRKARPPWSASRSH